MLHVDQCETNIVTERLRLTPLIASHAGFMFPILSERQLYHFTGDEPPESRVALEDRYRKLESRKSPDESQLWLNWLVSIAENDAAIGYVQATLTEPHTDIAWLIGLKWQSRGYASEAALALVNWLSASGVERIRACVNPKHVASQRVATNAGLCKSEVMEDDEEVWLLQARQ